jgi:hypothetical protein
MSQTVLWRDSVGSGNTFGAQSASTALAANSARVAYQIQNLDTAALFVKLGTGASTSSYSFVLKGGSGAADGSGGSTSDYGTVVYRGIITVASAGTPSYVALEL